MHCDAYSIILGVAYAHTWRVEVLQRYPVCLLLLTLGGRVLAELFRVLAYACTWLVVLGLTKVLYPQWGLQQGVPQHCPDARR